MIRKQTKTHTQKKNSLDLAAEILIEGLSFRKRMFGFRRENAFVFSLEDSTFDNGWYCNFILYTHNKYGIIYGLNLSQLCM